MAKNSKEVQDRANAKRAQAMKEVYEQKKLEKQMSKLEAHKNVVGWKNEKSKARAWAFITYPESAPENWKEILQKTGIEFAISPLHDSDKDPTEEDKKPHWHVIALWGNTTTGATARKITESVNAPLPIPLNGVKGYYRYFTHKDNPEKFQYDEKDIQTLNGFNIVDLVELKRSEVNEVKKRLLHMIEENDIVEYRGLLLHLLSEDLATEFDVASSHTIFIDKYITSRRNMLKEARMNGYELVKVDQETGEVLE